MLRDVVLAMSPPQQFCGMPVVEKNLICRLDSTPEKDRSVQDRAQSGLRNGAQLYFWSRTVVVLLVRSYCVIYQSPENDRR